MVLLGFVASRVIARLAKKVRSGAAGFGGLGVGRDENLVSEARDIGFAGEVHQAGPIANGDAPRALPLACGGRPNFESPRNGSRPT